MTEERWYCLTITACKVDYLGRHSDWKLADAVARSRHSDIEIASILSESNLHKLILNAWRALEIK